MLLQDETDFGLSKTIPHKKNPSSPIIHAYDGSRHLASTLIHLIAELQSTEPRWASTRADSRPGSNK